MPSALTQYGQKFFLGEKGVAKFLFAYMRSPLDIRDWMQSSNIWKLMQF